MLNTCKSKSCSIIKLRLTESGRSRQESRGTYRGEDRDPIRAALDAQLQDKISQKEREIRKVLEEFVEAEIEKRNFARSDFDFRLLDPFVAQVINEHARRFDPSILKTKHESFSRLLNQLRKEDSPVCKLSGETRY